MEKNDSIVSVIESLDSVREKYLSLDAQMIDMCRTLIQSFVERSEIRRGVEPVAPPELQAVLAMLDRLSGDMAVNSEVLMDNMKVLKLSMVIP